jgi:hypothetical protein
MLAHFCGKFINFAAENSSSKQNPHENKTFFMFRTRISRYGGSG